MELVEEVGLPDQRALNARVHGDHGGQGARAALSGAGDYEGGETALLRAWGGHTGYGRYRGWSFVLVKKFATFVYKWGSIS